MDISVNVLKTVEQNAENYFEKAKKFKKKIPGIKKTIEQYQKKLHELEAIEVKEVQKVKRKKEWFEKFRWFVSTDGFLVIGGRDATTNEIVIKKHTDPQDIVFHTELAGSPFVVIKNTAKTEVPESTITQAATFCASFSKSWKSGRTSAEVFYVNPNQVTKESQAGEFVPKGAFMIYGKRTFINAPMNLAVGIYEDKVMTGPVMSVQKHCTPHVEIIQGADKMSDVAKKIHRIIKGDVDEIVRNLPPECTIKKVK